MRGQFVPPRPGRVVVQEFDRPSRGHDIDDHGWFSIAPLPVGEFRLEWRTSDGWTARSAGLIL